MARSKRLIASFLFLSTFFCLIQTTYAHGQFLTDDIAGKVMGTIVNPEKFLTTEAVPDLLNRLTSGVFIAGLAGLKGKFVAEEDVALAGLPYSESFVEMRLGKEFPISAFQGSDPVPESFSALCRDIATELERITQMLYGKPEEAVLCNLSASEKVELYAAVIYTLFKTRSFMFRQAVAAGASSEKYQMLLDSYFLMTRLINIVTDPDSHQLRNGNTAPAATIAADKLRQMNSALAIASRSDGSKAIKETISSIFSMTFRDIVELYRLGGADISQQTLETLQAIYHATLTDAARLGYLGDGATPFKRIEDYVAESVTEGGL